MAKKTTGAATVSRTPVNMTLRGSMGVGAILLALGGFAAVNGSNDPNRNAAVAEDNGAVEESTASASSTTTVTSTTTAQAAPNEIGRSKSEPSSPDAGGVATVTEEITVTEQADVPALSGDDKDEPVSEPGNPASDSLLPPERDSAQSSSPAHCADTDSAPAPAGPNGGQPKAWGPKMGTSAPGTENSYGKHARLVPGQTHVISCGETLADIAHRSGVPMWTIAKANGIKNPDKIQAGTVIVIPS